MNVFTFTGNLGSDAEVRQVGNGSVCNFSVAVKSGYGDREKTEWIRCAIWNKRAEGALPGFLTKGKKVGVTGELSTREYESQGQTRMSVEVNVGELDLLDSRSDAGTPHPDAGQGSSQPGNNVASEDIPF